MTPPTPYYEPKRLNWDSKHWTRLDLDKPSTFTPWLNRARRFLVQGDPVMERLLTWLERYNQDPVTSPAHEDNLWWQIKGYSKWIPTQVSRELSDLIAFTSDASVAAVSRPLGEDRGFELYREIMRRIRGQGPEHAQRILSEILSPKQCKTAAELRDALLGLSQKKREL